ncbi:MAG TPA: PEP-CTERM sorting domain-containing protein, partial [Lacipirellulaceae bacterium]|nr:PEP-CTERM sorting domain-containing protein [Lacipirellulaceae bacterium]
RIDLGGVANLTTAFPNGGLMLQGGTLATPNTIAGGVVNGPGALRASTGRALQGFGTINARVEFEGTAELIADGGTLNVTGVVADVAALRVNSGATLNLTNSLSTSATNNGIVLSGGTLQGGTITVASIAQSIRGFGTVTSPIVNNGALEAQGGTLLVNDPANDWDGASNSGHLRATGGGTLEIVDTGTFAFGGAVVAVEGSRVHSSGFGLNFGSSSSLLLTQGTYESTNSVDIGGTVVIGAGASSTVKVALNSFLNFESASTTLLNGNLRLQSNNARIKAGAAFGGAGAIVVPEGSNNLVLDADANVNVLVENSGTLYPGGIAGVGRVDLRDFQQHSTGRLFVEVEGTSLNQYDRLFVNGVAQLSGYLNVDIDGPFVPAVGNTFNILSATGGITGTFNQVDIQGFPLGLTVKVNYLPTLVQLEVVNAPLFAADFDKDGDVDATDLAIWRGAYNLNQLGDATGDSRSDGADFLIWQRQLGSHPVVAAQSAVPEPGTLWLALLGTALAAGGRRRVRA